MRVSDSKDEDSFEVKDQKLAMKWNLFVMTTFGYWAPESCSEEKLKLYRWYTAVVVGLTLIIYSLLEIIALIVLTEDVEDIISCSFLLITHIMQWVKFYCFTKNRTKIIQTLNNLNQKEFIPKNKTEKDLLEKQVNAGKTNFYLFFVLATTTVTLWLIYPFVDSTGKIEELPLKAWFPFDTREAPIFQIICAYQAVAVMVSALTDASMVTLVGMFMASVCGQLDILNYRLQHLGKKSNAGRKNENTSAVEDTSSPDEAMIDCVRHHLKITE